MTSKSFQPDAVDYSEALIALSYMGPPAQIRHKDTLIVLQTVKYCYLEGNRTPFTRVIFEKAKDLARTPFNAQRQ